MREADLARVLLVRAGEDSDPEGRVLSHREREQASRLAREGEGARGAAGFLAARAELLVASIEARSPALGTALGLAGLSVPALAICALALLLGFGFDRLGSLRRINLLSFPLLGLLVWNLAVYTALLAGAWLLGARRPGPRSLGAAGVLVRGALWFVSPERPWMGGGSAQEVRWAAATFRRFLGLWLASARPLLLARGRRLLHAAAAAFALGAVLGLYVRGLAFEYRASWESTFLDPEGVYRVLSVVLGPAAWILDTLAPGLGTRELLSIEALERLQAPGGDGEAAIWIHLWALTTFLAIIAPRCLLAWGAARRARTLAADLHPSLDDPYFLRLQAKVRGEGLRVYVIPYSYRPSSHAASLIGELLLELFGNRASLSFGEPIDYGGQPIDGGGRPLDSGSEARGPAAAAPAEGARCLVVLFNLAQSPEQEVHGAFLDALKRVVERHGGASSLLVLLDEEPYRQRLGEIAPRLRERRRAWERLARESGLSAVPLMPLEADADAALAAARSGLWPASPQEVA